jgi:hypothetical protein
MATFDLTEGINKLREISQRAEDFDYEEKHRRALESAHDEEIKQIGISTAISFGAVFVFFPWVKAQ